jgi:hypothetical protein
MITAIMSVRVFDRYFQVGRTSSGCGISPVMDGTGRKVSYIRGRKDHKGANNEWNDDGENVKVCLSYCCASSAILLLSDANNL